MRKAAFAAILSLMAIIPFFSQSVDPSVLSYQRNFIRAGMAAKIEILNDASRITAVNMTPLYVDALAFVHQYYPVLGSDAQLIDLAAVAAKKIAAYNDAAAIIPLRDTFSLLDDSRVRIACVESLSALSADTSGTVAFLGDWFAAAVSPPVGAAKPDVRIIAACATALGKLAAISSFDALFIAATGGSDAGVVQASTDAINALRTGYTEKILGKMREGSVQRSRAAFYLALKNDSLSASDRGLIAEAAFHAAAEDASGDADSGTDLRDDLLMRSLKELKDLRWSQASMALTRYFYARQSDYKNGKISVEKLIPVIDCMGTMQSPDAAQALSIFLGLLNSETEQKKIYDEQLVLAVIHALGDLGDKTAFDYLLYIDYLDYPDSVKKASRDAIARLQW